jgi:hypothetical protein
MSNLIAGAGARVNLTLTNPASTAPPTDPITGDSLVDPAAITVYVRDGTGAITTYTLLAGAVIHDGVGLYHLLLDTTSKPGAWTVEVTCPAPVQCDMVGKFTVDPSPLHP